MGANITESKPDEIVEQVVIEGDLSKLPPAARTAYYMRVCQSLGLNPYTKPFDYIQLGGRLTLYARRDATDQLRKLHNISIEIVERKMINDIYTVIARAKTPDGRTDESMGAVSLAGKNPNDICNALMVAETKAKRRVTLSICGLGWLDETELETIPDVKPAPQDEPQEYYCSECGVLIEEHTTKAGRTYSAAEIAEFSVRDFGRVLCRTCGRKQRKEGRDVQETDWEQA